MGNYFSVCLGSTLLCNFRMIYMLKCLLLPITGAKYGGDSKLFYSQFELHTREQKIIQIVLLKVSSLSWYVLYSLICQYYRVIVPWSNYL